MTRLTEKTLTGLNADVAVPRYDRRDVSTGIVHIGVGNFHRSHQAMYIDTLMNGGAALDWGICGIGLQPSNVGMRDALAAEPDPAAAAFHAGRYATFRRTVSLLQQNQNLAERPGSHPPGEGIA